MEPQVIKHDGKGTWNAFPVTCHSRVEQVGDFSWTELHLAGQRVAMSHTNSLFVVCKGQLWGAWGRAEHFCRLHRTHQFYSRSCAFFPCKGFRMDLKGPPLTWKMKPPCLLEFEMSHYYLSTLSIPACCTSIKPDSAIQMKKQVICITRVWSIYFAYFFTYFLQINAFDLPILTKLICIYWNLITCQILCLVFGTRGIIKSLHPFFGTDRLPSL